MIYISAIIGIWNLPNISINYTKLHSIENKYYKIYTKSIPQTSTIAPLNTRKMALNSDKQQNDSFFDRITLRRLMKQKKLTEQKQEYVLYTYCNGRSEMFHE